MLVSIILLLLLINLISNEINGFRLVKLNTIRNIKSIILYNDNSNDNIIDIDVNNNDVDNNDNNENNENIVKDDVNKSNNNKKKDMIDPETRELIVNLLNVGLIGYLLGIVLEIGWNVLKAKRAGLL